MSLSLPVIVILVCAALVLFAAWLIWFADWTSQRILFRKFAAKYQLTSEYSFLMSDDGVRLAMRYWPNPESRYTVLFLHGNREDLGAVSDYLPRYQEAGFAVMALDCRGYGHSDGASTEASSYLDVECALEWLETVHYTPRERVIIVGFSLGGGPAVEMAVRHRLAGLILIGAFVSAYRVKTRWALVPGDKFENEKKVSQLNCPLLVVHGALDRTVPVWHGERLFAAAREPKMKLIVDGAYHSNVIEVAGARYWETVRAFTDSLAR